MRYRIFFPILVLMSFSLGVGYVHADTQPAANTRRVLLPAVVSVGRTTSTPNPGTAPTAQESEVIRLTNAERAKVGCGPVTVSTQLATAARSHSTDMGARDYFNHQAPPPTASTPWDRIKATGYRYSVAGENIAAGYSTPAAVMSAWMQSNGHRENILNCAYTQIGVGLARNDASEYTFYWTQTLATPLR